MNGRLVQFANFVPYGIGNTALTAFEIRYIGSGFAYQISEVNLV